jgi:hypothetical protein
MKKIFTALLVMLFALSQLVAQAPSIILVTDDDQDDDQYEFLVNQGFDVEKYYPGLLSAAGQDAIDKLNAADLVIVGRSPNSGDFDGDDKPAWNNLTVPLIINSQWVARSSRINWFESGSAIHMNDSPPVAYATALIPGDPIFAGVTLDGDSLGWCFPPHDYIVVDSTISGEVVASYGGNMPLVVRFNASEEFYPGSVDMPAGPRTYFGFGNDNAGWVNFFPLTKAAKQVYLNEITRILGVPAQEAVFGPTDTWIYLITDDDLDDPQFEWLQRQGFTVQKFWPGPEGGDGSIAAAGQDTIDMLNAADLVIVGRSPNSGNFDGDDKPVWNAITAPMIVNSQYKVRSSRLNWFESTNAYHENEGPALAYGVVSAPADPIFADVTLDGDSLGWCYPAHDFIGVDSAINGEVLVSWNTNNPLVVRFEADMEFYPGSVDMPAGPRTYFGFGNDNAGPANFFPLTRDAKQVYLAEICKLTGIAEVPEAKFGAADYNVILITDDNLDDPQYNWLQKNNIRVSKFWPGPQGGDGSIAAAGQDTIDMLNAADLVIVGRSPNSGNFDGDDKPVWNALTAPLIVNSQYKVRSSRLNWFESTNAYHMNDGPALAYGVADLPDDPVFSNVTLAGDSMAWCLPPHDFISNDSATNGTIVASFMVNNPLIARFDADVEFYPGAVDMPAGPRTYFGFGNDNGGFPNFFPLTEKAQQVYLNEISLMMGADLSVVKTVSTDANLKALEYDVVTATLTPAFHKDSLTYMLQLVQDSSVVDLMATPNDAMATVEGDSTIDVSGGDTLMTVIVVIAENGNQKEYEVTVYPFVTETSIEPTAVENLGVKMYPNPASDVIYIEAGAEIRQVTVYNAIGRVVMDQSYRNNERVQLNVGSLIPGLYMIKVDSEELSTMTKLLKK